MSLDNVETNQPMSLKVPGNVRKTRGDLQSKFFETVEVILNYANYEDDL